MGTSTSAPPATATREPVLSRDLAALSLSFFLVFMGAGAFQQYLIRYLQGATGRAPTECSWVLATVYLSFLVWRLFAPHTIRWLGDRRAVLLGQLTYTLFVAFAAWAHHYWILIGAAVLWGWGASAMWIASSTQVLDSSARTRYGTASGVFYAATHLGQWLGVALLGGVLARYGWGGLLGVALAASLAGNLVALAVPQRHVPREVPRLGRVFGMLRSRESKLLAAILFISSFGFGLLLSGFATLLTPGSVAWVTSGFYGGRLVASWFGGAVSDRLGRQRVLVWGLGLAAAGMLVGLNTHSPWALFAAALSLGVQTGTVPVAAMALIGDMVDPRKRHLAFGAIYVWRDLGVAVAILGAQYIVRFVGGYGACFACFAALFAAGALLAMRLPMPTAAESRQ